MLNIVHARKFRKMSRHQKKSMSVMFNAIIGCSNSFQHFQRRNCVSQKLTCPPVTRLPELRVFTIKKKKKTYIILVEVFVIKCANVV